MNELKPCPFCGGKAKLNKHKEPYCTSCCATIPAAMSLLSLWNYEIYMVDLWNRREEDK